MKGYWIALYNKIEEMYVRTINNNVQPATYFVEYTRAHSTNP